MKPIYRLTPHAQLSHNPLFALEARRMRYGDSGDVLSRRSSRWIGIGAAVVVIPFLAWMAFDLRYYGSLSVLTDLGMSYVTLALVIGLLLGLLVDCAAIAGAIGGISGELITGRWDLLRLTPLRVERLIAAKHGTAQLRAWRLMALVVGVRIGAVALLVFIYTAPIFLMVPIFVDPLEVVFGYGLIGILSLIFIIEPLWRLRALTAVGLAVSSRMQSSMTALLSAAGYVIALWIVEAFVFSIVGLTLSSVIGVGVYAFSDWLWFAFFTPLLLGVVYAAVWGFHHVVETWALRQAALTIVRRN